VAEAMLTRSQRPLVAVDIAVPRDIDPEVTRIAGVNLYDIDSLQEHLDQAVALRIQEVPQVEHILEEELQAFVAFMETLDILPIIAGLRQKAEQIRRQELEKTLRRLPALSPSEQAHLEAMTTALVKKLLHDPIQQLRAAAGGPDIGEYAFISRALFGLNGGQQGQPTPLSKHTPLNNHHYPAEGKTP
jgi:glutamyl-tRNA reductase